MRRRLWYVLCAVYTPFAVLTVWNKEPRVQLFVIALPWLAGLALVGVARYVVHGSLRRVWVRRYY